MIVNYVCKIICRESIRFDQDHIVKFCIRNCDISVDLIMECCLTFIRYIQTDNPWLTCCQIRLYFFLAQT